MLDIRHSNLDDGTWRKGRSSYSPGKHGAGENTQPRHSGFNHLESNDTEMVERHCSPLGCESLLFFLYLVISAVVF